MKILQALFTVLTFSISLYARQYFITGIVREASKDIPLSYANIRVLNTTLGTSANKEGRFELRLPEGRYKLVASYIGYLSDTLTVLLNKDTEGINFTLRETNINFPEIVVRPGENPALRIIRKAVERKKERDGRLNTYEYEAYTKGIIKTQNDISAGRNRLSIGIGISDTAKLKISGIFENECRGYFKKPGKHKEIILAQKQSANFPSTVNVFTGGRILKNFSSNSIELFDRPIPGPLADNAIGYYFYYLRKSVSLNNKQVYDIFMTPDDPSSPGFVGDIYIADSTYDLVKVDLTINKAANTGGIFDSVNIVQQFASFKDSIYMPVDYRLYVKANVLSLAVFGFELSTVFYDYKINPDISGDIFNMAVIKVLPGADKKDSTYWKNAVTIPHTEAEREAYIRIDSLNNLPRTFWDDFSPLSTRIKFSRYFSTSAPLGMYHFNRVAGNSLDFGLFLNYAADQRLNSSMQFSYGFSDKKFKSDFGISYLLGDYRTYKLSFNAFNKLDILFETSDNYNEFFTSLLSLISHYEFRDYYYDKGFRFDASGEVFPVLNLNAGIMNNTYNSAKKNTEFSFFAKDKRYKDNPAVYDTRITALTAGFNLDFRDYIEDGLFRRRITFGKSYVLLGGNITYSNNSLIKSGLNFTKYDFTVNGVLNTFKSAKLYFRIFGTYANGSLPYQSLYAVPGNVDLSALSFTFRTLNVNEVLGDRLFTINLEHYFGDELFRMLNIPFLKDMQLQLTAYLNIAYSDVGPGTRSILPFPVKTLLHPFYETGFELGQGIIPLQIDFSWRLNYRGENNFRIGINTFVF